MHILGAWRPGYLGNWKSGNLETWMAEELGNLGSWGPGKIAPPKKCQFFIWPLDKFNMYIYMYEHVYTWYVYLFTGWVTDISFL